MQLCAFLRHPELKVAEGPECFFQSNCIRRWVIKPERKSLILNAAKGVVDDLPVAPFSGAVVFADDAPVEALDRIWLGSGSMAIGRFTPIGRSLALPGKPLRQALEESVLPRQGDGLCALGGIGEARPRRWRSSHAQRLLELEGRFKMIKGFAK